MRASYRPAFWSVPTLRRQTGMESERGGARTRARNPLFRVQCLRAHPYGRKEALIAKVRQRTDVARADQAGQARPGPFECAACGNRVKSSNTDRFFFWYMSFDNGFMGRRPHLSIMTPAYVFTPFYQQIDRPLCKRCYTVMWLMRVAYDKLHHDKRTFECPVCRNSKDIVVGYQP
jgi:hypothetical protein